MPAARLWLPRALALAVFVLYSFLAPPGMYWLDASELSAASADLGAPHETGFPLYCLLGKLVSLVPLGELAFRYHLLSAAAGALAVLALCRLVDTAGRGDAAGLGGALAGGLLAAVALGFARQSTVAEVYAPNVALLAAALWLHARVAHGGGARDGLALAFVCGLGLGMHTTFRLLLALPVAVLLVVRLRRGARWPLHAPAIAIGVGLALHLYFPVRSATGETGLTDWGHPRTAAALVDYVTARHARSGLASRIMTDQPMVVATDARRFAGELGEQLGPLALVAAAGGLLWLLRERRGRQIGAALAVVVVGDAAFSIWVHPIGLEDLQNGLPTTVAIAALAGVGLAALARTLGRAAPFAAAALAIVTAIGPALGALPEVAASRDAELPRELTESGLDALPPRGVALVRSDSLAAGLMLLQVVEGARPDVAVLVRQQLADRAKTEAVLARADAGAIDHRRPLASILGGPRPVGWELEDDAVPAGLAPRVALPLAGLGPAGAPPDPDDVDRAAAELTRLFARAGDGAGDLTARRTYAHALTTLGRVAFGRGDLARAAALFEAATSARPEHAEAWVNRGVVASRRGDLAAAADATDRALAIEPNRVNALVNAARYRLALADLGQAEAHAVRALTLAPATASAWTLAGLAAARRGDRDLARRRLARALAIDPRQRDAAAGLAALGE